MEVVVEVGCGLDVHKDTVAACLIKGSGRTMRKERRTYRTFTDELTRMREWLLAEGCTHVLMESTGVYWKPVYGILEGAFKLVVGNAHHIKNVPGRKTDLADAEWLATLLRHGLVRSSFVPPAAIRQLRDLTRSRRKLIQKRTSIRCRVDDLLQTANIKLSSVASDLFGVSGRDMLEHLACGQTSPQVLAQLARGVLRKKEQDLQRAFHGTFTEHHQQLLQTHLSVIDALDSSIADIELRIRETAAPYQTHIERLDALPGINRTAATDIIAETGIDMACWSDARHFAAWAGLCPGNHESAGKRRNISVRNGNIYLKTILVEGAQAAAKTRGTYYFSKFQKLRTRRGHRRAVVAIAHALLTAIYYMLLRGTDYTELGEAYLDQRNQGKITRSLTNRLEKLGYTVTLTKSNA